MRSLVIVVILTVIATASCYEEFQCTFKNEYFHLDKRPSGAYEWGGDVKPLEINSKEELDWILERFDELRRNFYEKIVYNNFNSYMTTFLAMHQALRPKNTTSEIGYFTNINTKRNILMFSRHYEPDSFHSNNYLGILVTFLREISKMFQEHCLKAARDLEWNDEQVARVKTLLSKIEEHYFIAVGGMGVVDKIKISREELPTELDQEYLVGIIKLSVNGSVGYMIIDVEHPDRTTKVVMQEDPPSTNYKLIGRNKNFIQVKRSDVIFVGRPLCSLVATHNRILLLTDTLSLLKFNHNLSPCVTKAHVYAKLHPGRKSGRFDLGYSHDEDGIIVKDEIQFDFLSEVDTKDEKNVFSKVKEIFGFGDTILELSITILQLFLDQLMKP